MEPARETFYSSEMDKDREAAIERSRQRRAGYKSTDSDNEIAAAYNKVRDFECLYSIVVKRMEVATWNFLHDLQENILAHFICHHLLKIFSWKFSC